MGLFRLEYFLGSLLDECDGWRGWVDDIIPATDMLPDAVRVGSNVDLTLRGQALWVNGRESRLDPTISRFGTDSRNTRRTSWLRNRLW